jgi:hypothetical protein
MRGRWFTGAYDETGIDVTLVRLSGDPMVYGASVTALKIGSSVQAVKIYGVNLPAGPKVEDIGIGQGVKVSRIVSATPDEITVDVDVAQGAPIGARDLSVGGAVKAACEAARLLGERRSQPFFIAVGFAKPHLVLVSNFEHQKELLPMVKVSGRSYLATDRLPGRGPAIGEEILRQVYSIV